MLPKLIAAQRCLSFASNRTIVAGVHTHSALRAGHSKWANIRHIKALKDGQRSLQFIKVARQIRLAVQDGGSPNPSLNTPLRQALDEATKRNMPQHTIAGILKKAAAVSSATDAPKLKRYVIEARVLNKVFMVMVMFTDKYAGDRMQISTLFRKGGAVACDTRHMFDECGFVDAIVCGTGDMSAEQLDELCTEHAIDCGAEDVEVLDVERRHVMFVCAPLEIERLRQKLIGIGYSIENAEHVFVPNAIAKLTKDELKTYRYLKEKLQALDGVEDIYDNVGSDDEE